MVRPLYSAEIASGSIEDGATAIVGPPPDGFIWVLRDIAISTLSATSDGVRPGAPVAAGFLVVDHAQAVILGCLPGELLSHKGYHWQGRHVIPAGAEFSILLDREPFAIGLILNYSVSGYVLSSP